MLKAGPRLQPLDALRQLAGGGKADFFSWDLAWIQALSLGWKTFALRAASQSARGSLGSMPWGFLEKPLAPLDSLEVDGQGRLARTASAACSSAWLLSRSSRA